MQPKHFPVYCKSIPLATLLLHKFTFSLFFRDPKRGANLYDRALTAVKAGVFLPAFPFRGHFSYETNLSTFQATSRSQIRLSRPQLNTLWPQGFSCASRKGPPSSSCLGLVFGLLSRPWVSRLLIAYASHANFKKSAVWVIVSTADLSFFNATCLSLLLLRV